MRSLYESLLDDEEEVMNKTKLVPLMNLVEVKSKEEYYKVYKMFADQFKAYKENKIYSKGLYYDFSKVKDDDIIIYFHPLKSIQMGYYKSSKQSIVIDYSKVSLATPMTTAKYSVLGEMYVLPSAYKEDFEKIVNKYQKERKGRIL
jgi:hypothetical protein